jgi:ribosomal protein S18 acetylase RimI-like enzyme
MAVPKTIFRQATTADIPGMSAVRLAVRENRLSNPERITPAMYADHLGPLGRSWVGECNGQIVGFSAGALPSPGHDASIWALFVLPEYEGLGIGKQLLALAVEWLFAQGAQRIVLGTASGTRADAFYERLGWRRGAMRDGVEVEFSLDRSAG